MQLSRRPPVYALPSYSLTGDLLAFLRCGLQYRYTRIGQLPPSRPVQMWFGEFIHGVLEEAYRQYAAAAKEGRDDRPPWPKERVSAICELIKQRLVAKGLFAWDEDLEKLGDRRAAVALDELGPELFPLIHRAEVRLTGARPLPLARIPERYRFREADRYEMVGVIDVITHVELNRPEFAENRIVQAIVRALPRRPPKHFEVIIDYKGMRRPSRDPSSVGPSYWDIYAWQLLTYAHLRRMHEDSLPVVAGVIVYLNELLPTRSDLLTLYREIEAGTTDVVPERGSTAARILSVLPKKGKPPELPLEFRLARALRVVTIDQHALDAALEQFDDVVARIEACRGEELARGKVIASWEKNPSDEGTCAACDARTFCPSYGKETTPRLPGVKR